jgi:PPIC-type PPIASE domain
VDSLIDVLEPNASSAARRQLAINYARLVAASAAATRKHLEKDPLVAKQLQMQQKLVYMQVLANTFYRELEAEAKNVPITEIEKYYAGHQPDFERGDVRRLFVPKQIATASSESIEASKLKAKAEALRERAAAGEDFDNLQQAAYDDLGIKAPVATKLSMTRRTSLPSGEDTVFDLAPGQVTQVVDSPSAFVVLKLESKKLLSVEDAKPEILPFLQRERAKQVIRNTTESAKAEFNLPYFGLLSVPELFPPPQVTGLAGEGGTQAEFAQRSSPHRQMPPRRRGVAIPPPTAPR